MKCNDIETDLKPLLGKKLKEIREDEHGFVLKFTGGRTFTGHLILLRGEATTSADMRVFLGYHGRIPKNKRISRSCMG